MAQTRLTARPAGRRRWARGASAVAAGALLATLGVQVAAPGAGAAALRSSSSTGFAPPYTGTPRYVSAAPSEATSAAQVNQPLGAAAAAALAARLGLTPAHSFTPRQYAEFIAGKGVGGDPTQAALVDESVRILTNTIGRPLIADVRGVPTATVLASYGLFVTTHGLLESPANAAAPTRQVNTVIAPGGYLGSWCRANGATASLRMLYRSAYPLEAAYGFVAQQISGAAQLAPNTKGGVLTTVGMSMAPALWLVNFMLIYTLNPALAADMPARWTPVPGTVARALLASPTGQVRYSRYASYFP